MPGTILNTLQLGTHLILTRALSCYHPSLHGPWNCGMKQWSRSLRVFFAELVFDPRNSGYFCLWVISLGILCDHWLLIWVWEKGNTLQFQLVLLHRRFGLVDSGLRRLWSCHMSPTHWHFPLSSLDVLLVPTIWCCLGFLYMREAFQ
jgi:hypothetical protein